MEQLLLSVEPLSIVTVATEEEEALQLGDLGGNMPVMIGSTKDSHR
jgi:hypothetical protein